MGKWSLRWKLIAAFLAVSVLPLSLLGWWTERTARRGMETRLAALGGATRQAVGEMANTLSETSLETVYQVGGRVADQGTHGVSVLSNGLSSVASDLLEDAGGRMVGVAEAALGRQVGDTLLERARWMATRVEQLIGQQFVAMQAATRDRRLHLTPSEATAALSEFLASQPGLLGLALLRPDGHEQAHAGVSLPEALEPTEAGASRIHPWVADIRWNTLVLGGRAITGAVRVGPETDAFAVTLLVPVTGSQGEVVGVLAGGLYLGLLWEGIGGGLVGQNGSAFLVGPEGRVLGRTHRGGGAPQTTVLWDVAVAVALHGEAASDRVRADAVEVFRAFAPIRQLGWAVTAILPVQEAMLPLRGMRAITAQTTEDLIRQLWSQGEEQVSAVREEIAQTVAVESVLAARYLREIGHTRLRAFEAVLPLNLLETAAAFSASFRKTLAAATLILVGLSVAVGTGLAARIARRVSRLAAGAAGLGAGDLTARVPVESRDELGALAERFNAMAAALEQREREAKAQARALIEHGRELERLNAELQDASRMKSEFLANTSHELRTPLNAILGFIKLIRDGLCDGPEEEARFLKDAHESALHLLGLINNVLDIARIEAQEMSLTLEAVDLGLAFAETHVLTHVQALEKGVGLEFRCPEDAPRVRADAGKLKQVLVNLVGNALKFTSEGWVRITAIPHPDRGYVAVAVSDTGIGIAPEKQSRLFRPFSQADGSTTRRFGGTGLGLAISQALVHLMGGTIALGSGGEGQGTTVTFTLPIAHPDAPPQALPADVVPTDASRPLIVAVEDDGGFAGFLRALLSKSGYQCVTVGTADAGWEAALKLHPAAMTVDAALPARAGARLHSGWDLLRALQAEPATRGIPLLMLTGHPHSGPTIGGAQSSEVMTKPVDPDALLRRLAALTSSRARPLRVLVADDDPSVRTFLEKLLPRDRYQVLAAETGREVLDRLDRPGGGSCDVILLDLMMPDGTGYDVLRAMREQDGSPRPPVLILSNWPEPATAEDRAILGRAPVLAVLEKTAVYRDPRLLFRHLEGMLGSSASAREKPGPPLAAQDPRPAGPEAT
jgi:signal transduction histidine kinase/DNA-binding response OmpR family regulator